MAITNNGTKNNLSTAQIPSGVTARPITTFTDYESSAKYELSVLKATVDEATTAATFDAIFDNATIGLDKQILDIVAADYIASQTVTTWASLINLKLNNSTVTSGEGTWLKDTATSYVATVILYVKTA